MITTNPFSELSEFMPSIAMQVFVIAMIILVVAGTVVDMIHKKNVKYFFENVRKAKKQAIRTVSTGKKISIVIKTVASDVRFALIGGRFLGEATLLRFYVLHCIGLPFIIMIFMAVHFWRIRKDGGISTPV